MPSRPEPPPDLIVRADATPAAGLGHVMRSFALAEAWRDAGSRVTFAGAYDSAMTARLHGAGFDVEPIARVHPDANDLASLAAIVARGQQRPWIVIDGYHFDEAYQHGAAATGARVLVIDDEDPHESYVADLVLNPNLHGPALPYAGASGSVVLAGPRYALVRGDVRAAAVPQRASSRAIIVLTGGSDPAGIGPLALAALQLVDDAERDATIVIGPLNQSAGELSRLARPRGVAITIDPPDLASRMAAAGIAIAASGSTAWELCALGVPALYMAAADNQRPLGEALAAHGAGMYLGDARDVTPARLAEAIRGLVSAPGECARMSAAARALVDPGGAGRVRRIAAALDAVDVEPCVRLAESHDSRAIWRLANDPVVRGRSFDAASIPFEAHERWFAARLAARDERFWIADVEGALLGHVRYSPGGPGAAEVHFTIAAPARGRGLAAWLLERTAPMAARELALTRLTGVAMNDNLASHRAFERAGYQRAGEAVIHGRACVRFEKAV